MENTSITFDLLKSIHSEMKIAVQNHQLLVLRKKMCPSDPDIENHINVTQGLIISLGRSQAELLSALRKDPGFCDLKVRIQNSPNLLPKGVPHPQTLKQPIHLYKLYNNNNNNNNDKNKKIGFVRFNKKENIIQIQKGMQQSLLKYKSEKTPTKKDLEQKIIDGTKIKLVFNKKNEEQVILRNPKKQQISVLKSKNDKGKEICTTNGDVYDKLLNNERSNNLSLPDEYNNQNKSELLSTIDPSSPNDDYKSIKTSSSRSGSNSDESELNDSQEKIIVNREPKLVKKYDTRFLRKKKYTALLIENLKKSSMKSDLENKEKQDGDSSGNESNEVKPLKPEDLGQEKFLGYFGLVSKAKGDVLKRKRCERKRRSVAGQSSLYSDYYQPISSKRTYVKKSTSSPTSPNNQVIVETAIEMDDEDEKPKYCMVCNETGLLEMCQSCNGLYHEKCKPNPTNGCPNCSPHPTDINSIVGANFFASSSSYEIIKRYSASNNESNELTEEDKGLKMNSKELTV